MDITQVYALVIAGAASYFLLVNLIGNAARFRNYLSLQTSKYFVYPHVVNRHALIGPWSVADVFLQVVYLTANLFCVSFRAEDLSQAGLRAGTMALINLGPVFGGFHLDFLAALLGLSLKTYRRIHRSVGLVAVALAALHVIVVSATETSIFRTESLHPFVIIVGSTLCFLVLPSRRIFRRFWYEIFLRTHQGFALLCAYSIWRHLPNKKVFPRVYVIIFAALFGATSMLEGLIIFAWNGMARATVTYSCGTVKLRLNLPKPLKLEPGQYINLWMPVSFCTFLQSHPFVVTSWAATPQATIDLFIQPRRGFTRDLLYRARECKETKVEWAMFSGPHGQVIPVAAHLPYLKRLIHGYHARQVVTRRIHLVWQISDIDVGIAAQPFLNEALDEDKLESGGILQISIYVNLNDISEVSFGRRSTVYPGTADLESLLDTEMMGYCRELRNLKLEEAAQEGYDASTYRGHPETSSDFQTIERKMFSATRTGFARESALSEYSTDVPVSSNEIRQRSSPDCTRNVLSYTEDQKRDQQDTCQDKTLILVSGFTGTRDTMRKLARKYLEKKTELAEADFQPFRE